MAFMNQERKRKLAENLKQALKPYNLKYSLRVRNRLAIVMTIYEGSIDFLNLTDMKHSGYIDVNEYHYRNQFKSPAKEVLTKILDALNDGNHNNSDASIDHFDVGWYVDVHIGDYDRHYEYKPIK